MKNEALHKDIQWIKIQCILYMGQSWYFNFHLARLLRAEEMKNIFYSYGKEKLYKEDLERIIEMAEMLI